jgi:hypothetical protein
VVEDYDVIVPTAQNQINIENDLKDYFVSNLHKSEEALRAGAEGIVRAYDPCMSCATNFLKRGMGPRRSSVLGVPPYVISRSFPCSLATSGTGKRRSHAVLTALPRTMAGHPRQCRGP